MNMKPILLSAIMLCLFGSIVSAVETKDHDSESSQEEASSKIVSSIQLNSQASEQEEYSAAKLSVGDVVKGVEAKIPGKIVSVELENRDNNLVYLVTTIQTQGQYIDTLVDAGNGAILDSQVDRPDVATEEPQDSQDCEQEDGPWYEFW